MRVCQSVRRGDGVFARWAFEDDKDGERTLWITEGKDQDDFYGSTVGLSEKDVPKLILALEGLLNKKAKGVTS